jgi:hypothetical protein
MKKFIMWDGEFGESEKSLPAAITWDHVHSSQDRWRFILLMQTKFDLIMMEVNMPSSSNIIRRLRDEIRRLCRTRSQQPQDDPECNDNQRRSPAY